MPTLSSRREFIMSCASVPAVAVAGHLSDSQSLGDIALQKGILYGAAVSNAHLKADSAFAASVAREAKLIVGEGETKRIYLQPTPKAYDFGPAESLLSFASHNNMKMRGHTLAYYNSNPAWLEPAVEQTRNERLLTDYIQTVVKHFKGRFQSWDVVNEAIDPIDGRRDGLATNSVWFKTFGESYIWTAFQAARESDANTPLFYNEINLEGDAGWCDKRRRATLLLLERMIARNIPIDGIGIQGHLKAYKVKYSDEVLSRFLDDLASLGLKIMITEFDVADIGGPPDPAKRDADVASLTRRFFDVVLSKKATIGCLTWGISDKYSWLSSFPTYKWPDGELSRGLPLDVNFKRKPMWEAMASSFSNRSFCL